MDWTADGDVCGCRSVRVVAVEEVCRRKSSVVGLGWLFDQKENLAFFQQHYVTTIINCLMTGSRQLARKKKTFSLFL